VSTTETRSASRGRVRVEHGAKWVRAYLGSELVADTKSPLLVWEKPYYPTYYIPASDVRTELLEADGAVVHSPSRGDGRSFTVKAGGREASAAAVRYDDSPLEELRDAVRLEWDAMDAWFEDDATAPIDVYIRRRLPDWSVDIYEFNPRNVKGLREDGLAGRGLLAPREAAAAGSPAQSCNAFGRDQTVRP
jgi:uncharacterized protein (DUF427 family)